MLISDYWLLQFITKLTESYLIFFNIFVFSDSIGISEYKSTYLNFQTSSNQHKSIKIFSRDQDVVSHTCKAHECSLMWTVKKTLRPGAN